MVTDIGPRLFRVDEERQRSLGLSCAVPGAAEDEASLECEYMRTNFTPISESRISK